MVNFSLEGGWLVGAHISAVERPEAVDLTGEDGAFELALPSGIEVSFVLTHPDTPQVQTGALPIPAGGIEGVTFQVPNWEMYDLMASLAQVKTAPGTCQIATTVTCAGCDMFHGAFHGEPGATVTIEPPLPAEAGPVYFERHATTGLIWPEPERTTTSDDGGVLYFNVPPGAYELRAHKDGVEFDSRRVLCRAGWLVNASPPYGLGAR